MQEQVRFLEYCKERSGASNFVKELGELLGLGQNSIYQRLRGDIPLTFGEISTICKTYHCSYDTSIQYEGSIVPFQFNSMFDTNFKIVKYLEGIAQDLNRLGDIENTKISMTLMDMPYFRQFGFKALSRFKLFFWQRSVLNLDEFKHKKFDHREEMGEFEAATEKIYENYHSVNSLEIWAPETLDSTIKQVQYYRESGLFVSRDTALQVCADLESLLDKLEREAEIGKKHITRKSGVVSSAFEMYQSDIFLSNNCIQAFSNERVFTYVSFNSFNFLMTYTSRFSEECTRWIEQIRLKSILLSEVSEKLRYQFFLSLRQRIKLLRKEISE